MIQQKEYYVMREGKNYAGTSSNSTLAYRKECATFP